MVTSLVSPTRGFKFCFCVSGGERFFPRVDDMAVTTLVSPTRGFTSCVPREERFFPRRATTSTESNRISDYPRGCGRRHDTRLAKEGRSTPASVALCLQRRQKLPYTDPRRGDFIPAGASHFFRLGLARIGDGYRKLSLTPTGVPNES